MSLLPVGIGNAGGEYTLENSLRFREAAGAYLTRTPSSAGDRKTFTISYWHKKAKNAGFLFEARNSSGGAFFALKTSADTLIINDSQNSDALNLTTTQVFRDASSWYHIVVAIDTTQATSSNRAKLYVNGEQVTSFSTSSYPAQNADMMVNSTIGHYIGCGVNASGTPTLFIDAYLTEINFIDGQALTADDFGEFDGTTGVWKPKAYSGTYGTNGFYLPTTATTQAEGFNTVLYTGKAADQSISGVGFTPDLVWTKSRSNAYHPNIYDSVRGAQLALQSSSTTAELTGYPKSLYSFDTDGFTLGNQDNSNYTSGSNAVAWCWDAGANQATTGISSVTFEASGSAGSVSGFGFSPDLIIAKNRTNGYSWEWWDTVRGVNSTLFSNLTNAEDTTANRIVSFDSDGFSYGTSSNIYVSSTKSVAYGFDAGDGDPVSNTQGTINSTVKANDDTGFSIVSWTATGTGSDTIGHGLSTAPSVVIKKERNANDSWFVQHTSYTSGAYSQFLEGTQAESPSAAYWNNTFPTSTVFSQGTVMNSGNSCIAYCFSEVSGVSKFGSYTGTGTSGKAVTGLGFKPGFIIVKRTDASEGWQMLDSTRNPFAPHNSLLEANQSSAEITSSSRDTTFDSDGFTINNTSNAMNASGGTYIYMAFKGSYSDYVSPLNDTGTIDSRVKANTEKGFSIVSYEGDATAGATVGHGLTSAPEMVIVKRRDSTGDWLVWNETIASSNSSNVLFLNDTAGATSNSSNFNSTAPTSSVFTVGNNAATNSSGGTHIAYCFHSVAGYSDFGSYTGNGSATGPVVTTGFRPGFVLIKQSSSSGNNWVIYDNARNPSNPVDGVLYPNATNAEFNGSTVEIEFTDTGFQPKVTWSAINASSSTYIYMAFADTRDAQFNFDASGNKNNWTANNINSNASSEPSYDIMADVPTLTDEYTANYCTLNTLDTYNGAEISDGNLSVYESSAVYSKGRGTIWVDVEDSDGWYFEAQMGRTVAGFNPGIIDDSVLTTSTWGNAGAYGIVPRGGGGGNNYDLFSGTTMGTSTGIKNNVSDNIISVAFKNGKLYFAVDGTWVLSCDPETESNPCFSGLTGLYAPYFSKYADSYKSYFNFGQRPFKYTPPTGFKSLNTYNLPDATIEDGSEHFNTVLWTGTNADRSVTGVGFQPDFTWLKTRNVVGNNVLFDSNRGALKELYSNTTGTESAETNGLDYWESDGFHLKNARWNTSSTTYAAWNWKANGSGSSNTDGTASSVTVSANTTSGFSVVTYTGNATAGATVGHGLGVTPEMFIIKSRSNAYNWIVYHKDVSLSGSSVIFLNSNGTPDSGAGYLNNTGPTSSVFTVGSGPYTNGNSLTYVAYCFAGVEGFSSFGSYTGNGSTDGPFVYTGFRPAWIMVKRYTAVGNWQMFDSARDLYNPEDGRLYANLTDAENDQASVDFVSNGFKMRDTSGDNNSSGQSYIYMAFAENPFKNSLAR